jgi:hypothetical protein
MLESAWTPPPDTHSATTTSIEDQAKTPDASRHHRGTRGCRREAWRPATRGGTPLDLRVDDGDDDVDGGDSNVSGEVVMSSRVAEDLWRIL